MQFLTIIEETVYMHNQSWHIHWNKYVVYVKREIRSITITEPKTFFSFLKKKILILYTVYSYFTLKGTAVVYNVTSLWPL